MPRLTITITEDQNKYLDEISGEDGEYESKSEAVRNFIQSGERAEELEQTVERLQNEKQTLIEKHQEHGDLVEYVEEERSWRQQPLSTRLRWWIFGKDN